MQPSTSSGMILRARWRLLIGALVAATMLAGCSGSRRAIDARPDLPEAFPNHTLAQIQRQLRPAPDTLLSFEAKASLSIRSPQQGGNLTATMRHRRSDSLYMSLSPGLGIEAARVLVTPDSFFVYDRIQKQLTYGSLAFAASFLPAPLAGDDLFRNLLGLILPPSDVAWEVEADSAVYHLHDPARRRRYTVDPTVWRVVRYEERTETGEMLEERTYDEYDRFDAVYLPRRINLQRPLDDTRLSIFYRDLTLNPQTLPLAMQVGDGVERVLVDELSNASDE